VPGSGCDARGIGAVLAKFEADVPSGEFAALGLDCLGGGTGMSLREAGQNNRERGGANGVKNLLCLHY
jgi:hypothetical protein